MEKVHTNGQTVNHMWANGRMVSNMVKEFIMIKMDKEKKEHGKTVKI